MEYVGKLYAKIGGENGSYFPLLESTEDVERMRKETTLLKQASWKLLQAMGQHQFFSHGYAHGSASISEVMAAGDDEHKAYKELWDLLKQIEADAPVQQHS